ncbi:MAG TPA: tetratricopeptide repeat protein [Gaiellaceae bacterium]|nr:tetratricopeptide repeat protein [Gaiellaceae bacterium]
MAWQLLRENSPRGERFRRRVAVLAGASVFIAGMLFAAGLGSLVIFLVGAGLVGLLLATVAWLVERRGLPRIDLRPAQRFGARVARDAAPAVSAVQRRAKEVTPAVAGFATRTASKARAVDWSGWPYAGARPAPAPVADGGSQHRRALRLNARGAQLRGEGHPKEAAEQHSEALAIFRALGDRRGEAPTLNSLALALDAAGDTDAAVERFEEALTILRELDDERHEGKVTANLGFTLLRQGDDDHARRLLEAALEKLDPESRAAQQVVEQLRHAS